MNPQEIERTEFQTSFRGYDKSEVRNFLRRLSRELISLQAELGPASPLETGAEQDQGSPVGEDVADSDNSLVATEPIEVAEAGQVDEIVTGIEPVATGEAAQISEFVELGEPEEALVEVEPLASGEADPAGSSAPMELVDTDHQIDDDERFQVLGDRIAGLLKAAHQSATHLSEMAEAEVAEKLALAQAEGDVIRAEAETEAESIREAALAEAQELRSRSEQDAEEIRTGATELHTVAESAVEEAEAMKQNAVVAGNEEIRAQREEVEQLSQAAFDDRELALSELTDARGQVTDLLGEARSQSEFIRHEAEEVIRARVRKNMEQAEERLNVLRNSEIASRARIVAAHQELEGAIARLDIEEAPALPADPEHFALSGAQERAEASNYGAIETDLGELDSDHDQQEIAAGFDEVDEPEVIEVEVLEPVEVPSDDADQQDGFLDGGPIETEALEVESAEVEVESESLDVEFVGLEVEPDATEPVDYIEPDILVHPEDGASEDESADLEFAQDAIPVDIESEIEYTVGADVAVETDIEHAETAEVAEVEQADDELDEVVEGAGDVTQAEALPTRPLPEPDGNLADPDADNSGSSEFDVAEESSFSPTAQQAEPDNETEDALGRLVRQAMERAVDSARSSDR